MPNYGFITTTPLNYDQAVERATAALKAEGFGVLTQIDVQATLKQKLGADFRRYVILGACNPPLAHAALTAETNIGLLLPCNLIVYENADGTASVGAQNPLAAMEMVGNPALDEVAKTAAEKLKRVIASI